MGNNGDDGFTAEDAQMKIYKVFSAPSVSRREVFFDLRFVAEIMPSST